MEAVEIMEILENATLADLKDELELMNAHKDQYPPEFESMLIAEIEKRTK